MREVTDCMAKVMDKRLYGALKPVKRRVLLRFIIKCLACGAILALAQMTVWLCASFFVPIPHMWQKAAVGSFGILLIWVAVGAIFRPTIEDVVREADRLGLQERAITAYERMGLDDAFSVLQREDTIRRLKELDTTAIPVTPPKKWMLGLVGMALLILVGGMLPNPQNEIVDRRIRVQREIENQIEQLQDKVQENLTTQAELTAEEKQELMDLVNQLARRLRQTSDYKEAIKEVSKAEQELAGLVKRFRQYRMTLLGEALERHFLTRDLGQAAKAMEAQGMEHALESLKEQIKQGSMDAEAMQSLEAALKSAADALPNGSLKKQLEKAAGAVASAIAGQSGDVTRELGSLQEMLTYMAQEGFANPADIQYLLQNMKSSIANAAGQDIRLAQNAYGADQGLSSHSNGKTNRGPDSQKGNGQNSGGRSSNGQDSGSENGNSGGSGSDGQGSGSRQGDQGSDGPSNPLGDNSSGSGSTSTGQGSSSAGAGTGTGAGHTNRDAGYQEAGPSSQQGTKGQGDPDSYGDYERIYDPTRLGDGGQASQVTGAPSGQGASEQVEAGPGIGSFDGFVPYNEVFGSYRRQAMENLQRRDIPAGLRELIKEYFSALE